ncbi:MAG: hypothetical protein MUE30_08990 [Spirosomaceae bacterium]|nr:hypothetical protein [Spirosomataceae bacterium]
MKRLLVVLALIWFAKWSFAQTDSVRIEGKIENLTLRQYRKASEVTVARVNALRADEEIVRTATLNADGSFALTMPLIYPQEECFLQYDNLKIPFLVSNGTVKVVIDADSLGKSRLPFRFDGLHATANNLHALYEVKLVQSNITSQKTKPSTTPTEKWLILTDERDKKWNVYRNFIVQHPTNETLDAWVRQSLWSQVKAQYYAFLTTPAPRAIPAELTDSLQLDTTQLLTFAKADFLRQFSQYALKSVPALPQKSLSVAVFSKLILRYVSDIDSNRREQLKAFVAGQSAKVSDLNWMNKLIGNKDTLIQQLSDFELFIKQLATVYDESTLDYLKTALYVEGIAQMPMKTLTFWFNHIRPDIKNLRYGRSLDEIYRFENRDSVMIAEAMPFAQLTGPTNDWLKIEALPNLFLAKHTNATGVNIWLKIRQMRPENPTYVVFWSNDQYGRRLLKEMNHLKKQLPKLNYLFICDAFSDETIWIETVIKSKVEGIHLKLTDAEQNDFFVNEWSIKQVPHAVLFDATGKLIKRNAPLPFDAEGWTKIWDKVVSK